MSNIPAALPATHPGEVLNNEFLIPMEISQNALGRALGVSPRRINEIVHATRAITPRTALLLARYFGTSAEFWMNLQSHYDLVSEREALADVLAAMPPHLPGVGQ